MNLWKVFGDFAVIIFALIILYFLTVIIIAAIYGRNHPIFKSKFHRFMMECVASVDGARDERSH